MRTNDFFECPNRRADEQYGEYCRLDGRSCSQGAMRDISCQECPRMEVTRLECPECGEDLYFDNLDQDYLCDECGKVLGPDEVRVPQAEEVRL